MIRLPPLTTLPATLFPLTTLFRSKYYFGPKQAERPIYSYRLSIVHFWALIAIYMWAGPHHLLYTALPDWAQGLGMVFSLILLAPSWGGMINGMMTLSGAWHKLRRSEEHTSELQSLIRNSSAVFCMQKNN